MFGKLLKDHIEARGTTITQLAREVGISHQYLFFIAREEQRPPKAETCKKLAERLNLKGDDLLNFYYTAAKERLRDDIDYFSMIDLKPLLSENMEIEIPMCDSENNLIETVKVDIGKTKQKAIVIDSNEALPFVEKGQSALVTENLEVEDGDLVYIKLKDGRTMVRKYIKEGKNFINLVSVGDISELPLTITTDTIDCCYRIIGMSCIRTNDSDKKKPKRKTKNIRNNGRSKK